MTTDSKTAFCCRDCGGRVEAKNALAYRLLMQGYPAVCDGCRRGNGRTWSRATYAEYLATDYWQQRRARALKLARNKCQICSNNTRLEVHHNTYERLGSELDSDLFVVCERHHRMIHQERLYEG